METTVPPPSSDALPAGTRLNCSFGILEITGVLGQGGFGITYKAELLVEGKFGLTRSDAFFAVKEFFISDINSRIGTEVSGTESKRFAATIRKFERESRLLSGLDHPGVCRVKDAFRANGTAYYVMVYYGGGSLDALIRRAPGGALPEAQALEYVRQIGGALSYLHRNHLAHLDLKPQNVMLKPDGSLVLIDFGISKMFDEDGQFQTSDTMGGSTPGYAPLEQTNYSEQTGRPDLMDIYALGATLYKMLTGKRPPSATDVYNNGLPLGPLRSRGVSRKVIAVIIKAMQPRKADRYQSVDEMLQALPAAPTPTPVPAENEAEVVAVEPPAKPAMSTNRELSRRQLRDLFLIAASVICAILIAVGAFHFSPRGSSEAGENVNHMDTVREQQTENSNFDNTPADSAAPAPEKPAEPTNNLLEPVDISRPGKYDVTYGHETPKNLDLCAVRNGHVEFFNKSGWDAVPSNIKSEYIRKGIYLSGAPGVEPFILNLFHQHRQSIGWEKAMQGYRYSLPTKREGEIILNNYSELLKLIPAYGGDNNPAYWYWTSAEDGEYSAWVIKLNTGELESMPKDSQRSVRTVSPVPSDAPRK